MVLRNRESGVTTCTYVSPWDLYLWYGIQQVDYDIMDNLILFCAVLCAAVVNTNSSIVYSIQYRESIACMIICGATFLVTRPRKPRL